MPEGPVAARRICAELTALIVLALGGCTSHSVVQNRPIAAVERDTGYARFVDGGITDGPGLRALLETVEVLGGAKEYLQRLRMPPPRRIALIAVNVSTDTRQGICASRLQPTLEQTLNAVISIQLQGYNIDALQDMQRSLARWAAQLTTPHRPVQSYIVRLSFEDGPDLPPRRFLIEIPTSLALSGEQLDRLISTGRELLRNNDEFRRLVASLDGRLATTPLPAR